MDEDSGLFDSDPENNEEEDSVCGSSSATNQLQQQQDSATNTRSSNHNFAKQRKEKAAEQGLLTLTERFKVVEFFSGYGQDTTFARACNVFTVYFWLLLLADFTFCALYLVERILLEANGEIIEVPGQPLYLTTRPLWLYIILVILSFFTAPYTVFRFTRASFRQYGSFVLLFFTFVDVVTSYYFIVSLFFLPTGQNFYIAYYLRVWPFISRLETAIHDVNARAGVKANFVLEKIFVIVFTANGFVFAGLCAVNWSDNAFSPDSDFTVFNSFYFLIVTVSTVGYGDIIPSCWETRLIVIAVIVLALFVIPAQISALTETYKNQQEGGAALGVWEKDHYLVLISLQYTTPVMDALHHLLPKNKADFHRIVLLDSARPSAYLNGLLLAPSFKARVKVLRGSAMSIPDLKRVHADKARAVFLLTNKYDSRYEEADQQNALRAWSLQTFAPNVPLYVMNVQPTANIKNATVFLSAVLHKQAMLACGSLSRGLGTLLCNLWRHSEIVHTKVPWMDMYFDGLSNDLQECPVRLCDVHKTYSALALELFDQHQAILVGVLARFQLPSNDGPIEKKHVLLNPLSNSRDYVMQPGDIIFYIGQQRPLPGPHSQKEQAKTPTELFVQREQASGEQIPLLFSSPDRHGDQVAHLVSVRDFENSVYLGYPDNPHDSGVVPECFLYHNPINYDDAKLKNANHLRSHLLVFGDLSELFFFVCLLRSSHLRYDELFPILFFSDVVPTKKEWNYFARFPFVYFMKGQSVKKNDLKRCGLKTMRRACVVSNPRFWKDLDQNEEAMVDATCVMTTHHLLDLCTQSQHKDIITELVHRDNFTFISPKLTPEATYLLPEGTHYLASPAYASGRLLSLSTLDSILFQTYFRPHLLELVKLFCGLKSREQHGIDDAIGLRHQRLCCIDVPNSFFENDHQPTFGELFHALLTQHGNTAVALYRHANKDLRNIEWDFVYNNPFCNTLLLPSDRVFVISSEQLNPLFEHTHQSSSSS